jgi:hypothetical protein
MLRFSKRLLALWAACFLLPAPGFAQDVAGAPVPEDRDGNVYEDVDELLVGARVHALWMVRDKHGKPANEFRMNTVRLRLKWRASEMVEAALEADVADAFGGTAETQVSPFLRDAYVRLEPLKLLNVQMGQFKKPFSRIELRSKGKLETILRGVSNEFLVQDLLYGERDIGIMVDGRIGGRKKGGRYFVGAFNGTGKNAKEQDVNGVKDIVARIEADPWKWLSLGTNVSVKLSDPSDELLRPESAWLAGADARLRLGDLLIIAEGLFGQGVDESCVSDDMYALYKCASDKKYDSPPTAWSALLLTSYRIQLTEGAGALMLEPVLKAEMLNPNTDVDSGAVVGLTPAVNLHIGKHTRIMADGELLFAQDHTYARFDDDKRFLLQLAFDL